MLYRGFHNMVAQVLLYRKYTSCDYYWQVYIYILLKHTQSKFFCIHKLIMVMYKTVGCLTNCDLHFLYVTFISKLHKIS